MVDPVTPQSGVTGLIFKHSLGIVTHAIVISFFMFWGLRLREEIKKRYASEIAKGTPLVIRDEKTMSGRVHVGSLRGVVIHGVVSELLTDAGVANRYLFEINDFDLLDSIPASVDEKRYDPYRGRLLCDVPAPDGEAKNFAEYWAKEFAEVIAYVGFAPEYTRSSAWYREGKYNDAIRTALDHADTIRTIYKEVSGSVKDSDWFPLQVVCESCGKVGTTKVTHWDGREVSYRCEKALVTWAAGCGHEGRVSPFDGRAKLPWKVEWAAKFMVYGVHIEGAGKDHYTKGGSRDIARRLLKEVFHYPEPVDIPYNFVVVGGQKMSSSKGKGSSAKEIADLLPPHLVRLLLLKEPKREIDFEPYGDAIPVLFDSYDKLARDYYAERKSELSAAYPTVHAPAKRKNLGEAFLPRFSQVAYLVQMPHINVSRHVAAMKGSPLSRDDEQELQDRAAFAKLWLDLYSPEKYKFQLQDTLPALAKSLSAEQKRALRTVLEYLKGIGDITGEALHTHLHEIKKSIGISPHDLFSAIYLSFLAKDSGPQAGWFLASLDRDFVIRRLEEVTAP